MRKRKEVNAAEADRKNAGKKESLNTAPSSWLREEQASA